MVVIHHQHEGQGSGLGRCIEGRVGGRDITQGDRGTADLIPAIAERGQEIDIVTARAVQRHQITLVHRLVRAGIRLGRMIFQYIF